MSQSEALDKQSKKRKRLTKWLECLTNLLIFSLPLILIILLLPHIQYSREAARCMNCRNNMEQIGITLQNYHNQHGSFPPAYTVDEEGNPLHSWRTLILPYFAPGVIEPKWKEMYEQLRFDEPWDSEHNMQCLKYTRRETEKEKQKWHSDNPETDYSHLHNMPAVYSCPNHPNELVETVYKMVVGDNAIGNVHGTSVSQITRPISETILVVESGLPVHWMKPSDFAEKDFKTAVSQWHNSEKIYEILEADRVNRYGLREIVQEEGRTIHYDRGHQPYNELADYQILGGNHGRELHILFVDGNVKSYWDGKWSISDIEAMSRIRE